MAMVQRLSKIRAHTTGLVSVILKEAQAAGSIKMDGCIGIQGPFTTFRQATANGEGIRRGDEGLTHYTKAITSS